MRYFILSIFAGLLFIPVSRADLTTSLKVKATGHLVIQDDLVAENGELCVTLLAAKPDSSIPLKKISATSYRGTTAFNLTFRRKVKGTWQNVFVDPNSVKVQLDRFRDKDGALKTIVLVYQKSEAIFVELKPGEIENLDDMELEVALPARVSGQQTFRPRLTLKFKVEN